MENESAEATLLGCAHVTNSINCSADDPEESTNSSIHGVPETSEELEDEVERKTLLVLI